ncbi:hypothetical protein BJ742DRAFT_227014 [Cladochytrium replicatum]|nr:hypothetical protein BJ742DRAFT_227014 [Cladochytrium replicatum]
MLRSQLLRPQSAETVIRSDNSEQFCGIAQVCFVLDPSTNERKWWQGHLIDVARKREFGFVGVLSKQPPSVHQCCVAETHPIFWTVTVLDYNTQIRTVLPNVLQPEEASDNVRLTTNLSDLVATVPTRDLGSIDSQLEFRTTVMKVDDMAAKHVERYFPALNEVRHRSAVCMGEMDLTIESF